MVSATEVFSRRSMVRVSSAFMSSRLKRTRRRVSSGLGRALETGWGLKRAARESAVMVSASDPFGPSTPGTLPGARQESYAVPVKRFNRQDVPQRRFHGFARPLCDSFRGKPATWADGQARAGEVIIVEDSVGARLGRAEALVQIEGRPVAGGVEFCRGGDTAELAGVP